MSQHASRAASLDLLLKTFTNPTELFAQNSLVYQFEHISRIAPGITTQQCTSKWEELRSAASSCDGGGSSNVPTEGKPLSQVVTQQTSHIIDSKFHRRPNPSTETHRPSVHSDSTGENLLSRLKIVASDHGGRIDSSTRDSDTYCASEKDQSQNVQASTGNSANSISPDNGGCVVIIRVFDEAKRIKQDFACPRDILVNEMKYFAEHLSLDSSKVEDIDITVHCDVTVFDWLMRYMKRGMREGPGGESLTMPQEAPSLELNNAASILTASNFLQMESLVEDCLKFLHDNISQVTSLNACNISNSLMARLVAKFTPTEVEQIVDKKNKLKCKMYAYLLQQFFSYEYYHPDCPANGSTLFRCVHCCQLLTTEQQSLFPCAPHRAAILTDGSVGYEHQRDSSWTPAKTIQGLQHRGYSLREIFWWFWGSANWLMCLQCKKPFKCNSFLKCAFHVMPSSSPSHTHSCCGKVSSFSLLPSFQNGCTFREHIGMGMLSTVPCATQANGHVSHKTAQEHHQKPETKNVVVDTLQAFKDIICMVENEQVIEQPCAPDNCLLWKEHTVPPDMLQSILISGPLQHHKAKPVIPPPLQQRSSQKLLHVRRGYLSRHSVCREGGGGEEEEEVEEEEEDGEEDNGCPSKVSSKATSSGNRKFKASLHDEFSQPAIMPHKPLDWIWDITKPFRWNQDQQRDSDEHKLSLIVSKMQSLCTKLVSQRKPNRNKQTSCSGGIFCHLEAKFRARQQTCKGVVSSTSQKSLTFSEWKK